MKRVIEALCEAAKVVSEVVAGTVVTIGAVAGCVFVGVANNLCTAGCISLAAAAFGLCVPFWGIFWTLLSIEQIVAFVRSLISPRKSTLATE